MLRTSIRHLLALLNQKANYLSWFDSEKLNQECEVELLALLHILWYSLKPSFCIQMHRSASRWKRPPPIASHFLPFPPISSHFLQYPPISDTNHPQVWQELLKNCKMDKPIYKVIWVNLGTPAILFDRHLGTQGMQKGPRVAGHEMVPWAKMATVLIMSKRQLGLSSCSKHIENLPGTKAVPKLPHQLESARYQSGTKAPTLPRICQGSKNETWNWKISMSHFSHFSSFKP